MAFLLALLPALALADVTGLARAIDGDTIEVAVSGRMFGQILARIARLRAPPPAPA